MCLNDDDEARTAFGLIVSRRDMSPAGLTFNDHHYIPSQISARLAHGTR